jgi:hypothetical protein
MIAFVGICCAIVGTVLGAMKASGREHLTVSLLMIGSLPLSPITVIINVSFHCLVFCCCCYFYMYQAGIFFSLKFCSGLNSVSTN